MTVRAVLVTNHAGADANNTHGQTFVKRGKGVNAVSFGVGLCGGRSGPPVPLTTATIPIANLSASAVTTCCADTAANPKAGSSSSRASRSRVGIDQDIETPGKIYNKNGQWRTGPKTTDDVEQSVAFFLQEDMECVALANGWVGTLQASLRNTIRDAYLANLE